MASMTTEVRNAMRDLLADIVGTKHEVQTAITAASLRKATLIHSETSVREDIKVISAKIQSTLKMIADKANKAVGDSLDIEREKVNSDILFLEQQHKRLEETEEEVRSKTSNISMKVMKDGRDVCDAAKEAFEEYQTSISQKKLQFVLHGFLATILEQIETFSMGEVKVIEVPSDQLADLKQTGLLKKQTGILAKRSQSVDPSKSSFSRSNSQDPIKTSFIRSKSSQILRTQQEIMSRSNSRISDTKGVGSRRGSVSQSKPGTTANKSRNNSKRTEKQNGNALETDSIKAIAGLEATVVNRSLSEPLLNLISKERGVFIKEKAESETIHPEIAYKELIHTKTHKDACYITGISVLPNGNVLICDNVHDSLQLFNQESQQISELLCDHPWAVTTVSDTAVAVTIHYGHKVILVNANEHLEQIADKEIKLKCESSLIYDIKHYEYRLYVLCINGDVHVMDIKGKEYKTIRTGMLPNVLKFFDVDVNKKRLIVSGDNGVTCVNFEGLHQWSYRPRNKFVSTGITIVKGHVIVCDWENHCVTQIYDEGKKATTVLAEGLEKPVVVCVDPSGQNYYFSQGDYEMETSKTRTVKVFELV